MCAKFHEDRITVRGFRLVTMKLDGRTEDKTDGMTDDNTPSVKVSLRGKKYSKYNTMYCEGVVNNESENK